MPTPKGAYHIFGRGEENPKEEVRRPCIELTRLMVQEKNISES